MLLFSIWVEKHVVRNKSLFVRNLQVVSEPPMPDSCMTLVILKIRVFNVRLLGIVIHHSVLDYKFR